MVGERRGYLLGAAAYLMWGFFPPYFKLLRPATAVEILAHRIVWAAVFVTVLLLALRRSRSLSRLEIKPRVAFGIGCAAIMIAVNWGTYLYSVISNRVVEASLGYFINPLVTVALGVVVLRERLRVAQWIAMGIGALAVTVLTIDYGQPPWIALTLALSFASYGLFKKRLAFPAAEGLLVESATLAVPALVYLGVLTASDRSTFGTVSAAHTALLILAGVVTVVPLLCFADAANRIPLSALGIMQYVTPMMQFGFGVLVYREAMPPARLASFTLVWLALALFTWDALRATQAASSRGYPRASRSSGSTRGFEHVADGLRGGAEPSPDHLR